MDDPPQSASARATSLPEVVRLILVHLAINLQLCDGEYLECSRALRNASILSRLWRFETQQILSLSIQLPEATDDSIRKLARTIASTPEVPNLLRYIRTYG